MSTYRYLLHFAYIGTRFRGSQRQTPRLIPRIDDPSTIQGKLEMALKKLDPCNEPVVFMSSRTDAGVHAINTTCHVDLVRKNGTEYNPKSITVSLNRYFERGEVPIRILQTYIVPNMFNSRYNAMSRTYLYRMVVGKTDDIKYASSFLYLPIEEWSRCLFFCTDTFDLDKMKEGAHLLEGYHDFRSFMAKSYKNAPDRVTRRIMEYIKIEEGEMLSYSPYSWPGFTQSPNEYLYLNVYLKSSGFLYKQVRRTVAALVALAQGKVSIRDIKLMLEIPSRYSWCPRIKTLPAHGLYLCEVEYSKQDIDTFRTEPGI